MAKDDNNGDFIDFIIKAAGDQDLAEDFLAIKNAKKLHSWFQDKVMYKDITDDQCERILDAVKHGTGKGINKKGLPVEFDPIGPKSY